MELIDRIRSIIDALPDGHRLALHYSQKAVDELSRSIPCPRRALIFLCRAEAEHFGLLRVSSIKETSPFLSVIAATRSRIPAIDLS